MLLALHFVFVKGQPICVARQYTVRDGLIQSNPAQILQSHNGFIWVSTWNGVSRFDGRDFETFSLILFEPAHAAAGEYGRRQFMDDCIRSS